MIRPLHAALTALGQRIAPRARPPRTVTALMLGERCRAVRVEATPDGLRLAAVDECSADELPRWRPLLRGSSGVLVLNHAERHLLTLDRPDVPDAELALAVRWPLAEALEAEPEDLLTTVVPLPVVNEAMRPQMLAIAARVAPVREQLATLAGAGLVLQSIDIADSALRGMALLQPRGADGWPEQWADGWLVVASMGANAVIGMLWRGEFCALRSLSLPQQGAADADDGERLALQIQRTADLFERQSTQMSIRRGLVALGSLPPQVRDTVRAALPVAPQLLQLPAHLAMDDDTRRRCEAHDDFFILVCVAAARLIDSGALPGRALQPADGVAGDTAPGAKVAQRPDALAAALIDAVAARPAPASTSTAKPSPTTKPSPATTGADTPALRLQDRETTP